MPRSARRRSRARPSTAVVALRARSPVRSRPHASRRVGCSGLRVPPRRAADTRAGRRRRRPDHARRARVLPKGRARPRSRSRRALPSAMCTACRVPAVSSTQFARSASVVAPPGSTVSRPSPFGSTRYTNHGGGPADGALYSAVSAEPVSSTRAGHPRPPSARHGGDHRRIRDLVRLAFARIDSSVATLTSRGPPRHSLTCGTARASRTRAHRRTPSVPTSYGGLTVDGGARRTVRRCAITVPSRGTASRDPRRESPAERYSDADRGHGSTTLAREVSRRPATGFDGRKRRVGPLLRL